MNICSHPADIFSGRLFMLQEDNRKQTAYSMTLQKKSLGAELGFLQSRLFANRGQIHQCWAERNVYQTRWAPFLSTSWSPQFPHIYRLLLKEEGMHSGKHGYFFWVQFLNLNIWYVCCALWWIQKKIYGESDGGCVFRMEKCVDVCVVCIEYKQPRTHREVECCLLSFFNTTFCSRPLSGDWQFSSGCLSLCLLSFANNIWKSVVLSPPAYQRRTDLSEGEGNSLHTTWRFYFLSFIVSLYGEKQFNRGMIYNMITVSKLISVKSQS